MRSEMEFSNTSTGDPVGRRDSNCKTLYGHTAKVNFHFGCTVGWTYDLVIKELKIISYLSVMQYTKQTVLLNLQSRLAQHPPQGRPV